LSAIAEYEEEKVDSLMGRIQIFYFEQAQIYGLTDDELEETFDVSDDCVEESINYLRSGTGSCQTETDGSERCSGKKCGIGDVSNSKFSGEEKEDKDKR